MNDKNNEMNLKKSFIAETYIKYKTHALLTYVFVREKKTEIKGNNLVFCIQQKIPFRVIKMSPPKNGKKK